MPKLDYKTKLIWSSDKKTIFAFYKYNNNIGYIPAGISFTHRDTTYTTPMIMSMIVKAHMNKRIPQTSFTVESWLKKKSINTKQFIKYYKLLL